MKQAVILAAGEGQRLRPFTVNKPKVMLSIAGKPILSYVVEALAQSGIRSIVPVVGFLTRVLYISRECHFYSLTKSFLEGTIGSVSFR